VEPDTPKWVEDTSELELLKMVCQTKISFNIACQCPIQLHEKDEIDNEPAGLSLQEPWLKNLLRAVETLYMLALFHSHEPEFSNFFHTLLNV